MATVPRITTPIQHYASYVIAGEEVYGVATLIAGGYSFRPDDSREVRLVSYKDGDLLLYGRCDLADGQYLADELAGGAAALACTRQQEVA
jgi:hypothetical protein